MGLQTNIYVKLPDGSEAERLFRDYRMALYRLETYLHDNALKGELLVKKPETEETDSCN